MKNFKLIFFIIINLSLFSCSNDDDANNENNVITKSDLSGSWRFQNLRTGFEVDLNNDGISSTDLFEELDNCFKDNTYVFEIKTSNNGAFKFLDNQFDCDETIFIEKEGVFNVDGNNNISLSFPSDIGVIYDWTNITVERENDEIVKIEFRADDFELGFVDGAFGEACCATATLTKDTN